MKIEPIKLLPELEKLRDYYKRCADVAAGTILAPSALFVFKASRNAIAALMRMQDLGANVLVVDSEMVGVPSANTGRLYYVRKLSCSCQATTICKHMIVRDAAVAFVFGEEFFRI